MSGPLAAFRPTLTKLSSHEPQQSLSDVTVWKTTIPNVSVCYRSHVSVCYSSHVSRLLQVARVRLLQFARVRLLQVASDALLEIARAAPGT